MACRRWRSPRWSYGRVDVSRIAAASTTGTRITGEPIQLASFVEPQARDTGAARRLHEHNPFDWVGALHNRLVREAPAAIMGQLGAVNGCERATNAIASRPEISAMTGTKAVRPLVRLGLSLSRLCGRGMSEGQVRRLLRAGTGLNGFVDLPPVAKRETVVSFAANRKPHPMDVTSAADPYFDAIDAAVGGAADADSYATALAPILATAQSQLSGDDLDAVESVVSVAQSSFEQRSDPSANEAEVSQMTSLYGDCVAQAMSTQIIYDPQQIIDECGVGDHLINLRTRGSSSLRARGTGVGSRAMLARRRQTCDYDWRSIVHGDVAGAVGGAIAGAVAGGAGAGPGALAGGVATSAGEAIWSDITYIICIW
jgi:hypothetical protein